MVGRGGVFEWAGWDVRARSCDCSCHTLCFMWRREEYE